MANEVTILEFGVLRNAAQVLPYPPLAIQTLTIGGPASKAFTASTAIIQVITTTPCRFQIGATPSGLNPYPIPDQDIGVKPGHKIIAVI